MLKTMLFTTFFGNDQTWLRWHLLHSINYRLVTLLTCSVLWHHHFILYAKNNKNNNNNKNNDNMIILIWGIIIWIIFCGFGIWHIVFASCYTIVKVIFLEFETDRVHKMRNKDNQCPHLWIYEMDEFDRSPVARATWSIHSSTEWKLYACIPVRKLFVTDCTFVMLKHLFFVSIFLLLFRENAAYFAVMMFCIIAIYHILSIVSK